MWKKSENGESKKPAELESYPGGMIVRRNFRLIEASEEMPEYWSYEEWQMTSEQYEVYVVMMAENHDVSDALIELADLIAEVING